MYYNPWIPDAALRILSDFTGSILDIGGGGAPFWKASHIIDIQKYSQDKLVVNAWGVPEKVERSSQLKIENKFSRESYTQMDLCGNIRWPFADKTFDLGLCSHTLEDLRNPFSAIEEMNRCCRQLLIVCPSRLLEQTRGVDHPRYCGFYHHPWMVFEENGVLVFRRKTPIVEFPGCHITCPLGKTLKKEYGSMFLFTDSIQTIERAFWNEQEDYADYSQWVGLIRNRRDLFVPDTYRHNLKYWIWKWRQKFLGAF